MKNVFKISTAVAAAAVTAAAVTLKTVSDYAISGRSRIGGKRHAGEQPLPYAAQAERVGITACDGTKLAGCWVRTPSPRRIVLAVHGWRSEWYHDFRDQCPMLMQLGCDVLYVDQRAHGNSGGDYIGFGVTERFDCLEWVRYIEDNNPDGLPVYLFGVSMGATTVMLASELLSSRRVHGIIADCGFTSAGDIWRYAIENKMKYGADAFYKLSDLRCYLKAGYHGDTRSTVQTLANTDIPVLFIHGGADKFVPTSMSYINYNACASKKTLLIVEGAKHARSCRTDPEKYRQALIKFFETDDK